MSIGDAEIKTQERVIRFFKDPEILGYQYIGNLSDYVIPPAKNGGLYNPESARTCTADGRPHIEEQVGGGRKQLEDDRTKIHALSNRGRVW